jgi:hypothetical protein
MLSIEFDTRASELRHALSNEPQNACPTEKAFCLARRAAASFSAIQSGRLARPLRTREARMTSTHICATGPNPWLAIATQTDEHAWR